MSDPLRIALLLGRFPPHFGGHGIQMQRLLPHLLEAGLEPEVICIQPPPDAGPIPESPVPVHRIMAPETEGRVGEIKRVLQLRRFLLREHGRFDVLHSALLGWQMYVNAPLLSRLGLPWLLEMILIGSDDPMAIQSYPFGKAKLDRLRGAGAWVGLTSAFRESVVAAGIPAERFHTVFGGVDLDRFRPVDAAERASIRRELAIPDDARVLVSAGALLPRKGMDRVLRGFIAARPEPGRDLLVLVGPASEREGLPSGVAGFPDELRRMAREAGVEACLRIEGMSPVLERYYQAADLYCFLSHKEGLGYVTIEAMACGLPAIVSPMDGIGAELVPEGCGFVLSEPDDAPALGPLLRGLLDDPARREALGRAAHADAVERFSMGARAAKLSAIYHELAGR